MQYVSRVSGAPIRRCAGLFAVLGLLAASSSALAASETLYHFVDERGIPHFSNVPLDKRYRPFARVSVAAPMTDPGFDDAGQALPYEEQPVPYDDPAHYAEDPVPSDETVRAELYEEHLPVSIQEH